jgi:hypothetical protein
MSVKRALDLSLITVLLRVFTENNCYENDKKEFKNMSLDVTNLLSNDKKRAVGAYASIFKKSNLFY